MIYVMSDLHGQYNAFLKMLELIKFTDEDELYILGDIIDRGPNPLEIYDYIKDRPNIHMLMGNHERMMMDYYDEKPRSWLNSRADDYRLWMRNGGKVTEDAMNAREKDEQEEIKEFFNNLEYYKLLDIDGEKFILSHARPCIYGLASLEDELAYNIKDQSILWNREISSRRMKNGYRCIHGHTPVQYAFGVDTMVAYSHGEVIDIDCGCAGAYSLACLRLDDMKQFYIDDLDPLPYVSQDEE